MKSKFIPDATGECAPLSGGLSNRIEERVLAPEEIKKLAEPKHPVVHKTGGIVEQLHDRVVLNLTTRSPANTSGQKVYWMLRVEREFMCGLLERMIKPGETVQCMDAYDYNTLTAPMPDGPLCSIIEEVRQ